MWYLLTLESIEKIYRKEVVTHTWVNHTEFEYMPAYTFKRPFQSIARRHIGSVSLHLLRCSIQL